MFAQHCTQLALSIPEGCELEVMQRCWVNYFARKCHEAYTVLNARLMDPEGYTDWCIAVVVGDSL